MDRLRPRKPLATPTNTQASNPQFDRSNEPQSDACVACLACVVCVVGYWIQPNDKRRSRAADAASSRPSLNWPRRYFLRFVLFVVWGVGRIACSACMRSQVGRQGSCNRPHMHGKGRGVCVCCCWVWWGERRGRSQRVDRSRLLIRIHITPTPTQQPTAGKPARQQQEQRQEPAAAAVVVGVDRDGSGGGGGGGAE